MNDNQVKTIIEQIAAQLVQPIVDQLKKITHKLDNISEALGGAASRTPSEEK